MYISTRGMDLAALWAAWHLGFLAHVLVLVLAVLLGAVSLTLRRRRLRSAVSDSRHVRGWQSDVGEGLRIALRSRRLWLVAGAFVAVFCAGRLAVTPTHEAHLSAQLAALQQHHRRAAAAHPLSSSSATTTPLSSKSRSTGSPRAQPTARDKASASAHPRLCFGIVAATERDTLPLLLSSVVRLATTGTDNSPQPPTVTLFPSQSARVIGRSPALPAQVREAALPAGVPETNTNLQLHALETLAAAGCDHIVLLEDDALPAAITPGWRQLSARVRSPTPSRSLGAACLAVSCNHPI